MDFCKAHSQFNSSKGPFTSPVRGVINDKPATRSISCCFKDSPHSCAAERFLVNSRAAWCRLTLHTPTPYKPAKNDRCHGEAPAKTPRGRLSTERKGRGHEEKLPQETVGTTVTVSALHGLKQQQAPGNSVTAHYAVTPQALQKNAEEIIHGKTCPTTN